MPLRKIKPQFNVETTNFIVTYFIVGILALLLAFVSYTSHIVKELDEAQRNQVEPLADLASVIPSIKDIQFSKRINDVFIALRENSRLSFIITDFDNPEQMVKVRGIDKKIAAKLDVEPAIPLEKSEEEKLNKALGRMKKSKSKRPIAIEYVDEDRVPIGYFYHGDANEDKIGMLPFVFTDLKKEPIAWKIWGDYTEAKDAAESQIIQAHNFVREADAALRVLPIQINPKPHRGYFYYETAKHYNLVLMPYVQIALITTFLLVGLLVYRKSKANEQAAIWVGLAKETAHQLGTPIMALMGWTELLEDCNSQSGNEMTERVCKEMQGDLNRLQKINLRFGNIGDPAKRDLIDISATIQGVVLYFRKRLPNRGKNIELIENLAKMPLILANEGLLEWVFENLIKNSLDALDKEKGIIEISTYLDMAKNHVVITYEDNGKGIPRKNRKKIFQPGYTTKKHSWGLGLTLVKRIIEEYHNGKIRLADTGPDGTTFEIRLPVKEDD